MDLEGWWASMKGVYHRLAPAARLRIFIYIVFALQLGKAVWLVPVDEIFDGVPLTDSHFSRIYSDVINDRALMRISHRSWGYDPLIGAGQPVGSGLVAQSHAFILFDRLLRRNANPAATIKLLFLLAFLVAPFLVMGAARLFSFNEASAAVVLALAAGGSLGHEYLSRALLYQGNITFWFAAHLALFNAGALYSALSRRSTGGYLAFALTLPLLVLLDPAVALMQIVPVAALTVDAAPRQRSHAITWTAAALALTLVVNGFWIRPFLIFHSFSMVDMDGVTPGLRGLFSAFLSFKKIPLESVWTFLRAYVLIFGISELMFLFSENRALARTLLIWTGALFLVGFFGGYFSWVSGMEPAHLGLVFFLVLTLPAASFMTSTFFKPGSRRILLFAWSLWFIVSWQTANHWEYPAFSTEPLAQGNAILADFDTLPRDRRVLVEASSGINELLSVVRDRTKRSYVGSPSSWWNTEFGRSVSFDRKKGYLTLCGKPFENYDGPMLQAILDRYNVGYLLIFSRDAEKVVKEFPGIIKPYRVPQEGAIYRLYEVKSDHSGFFIEGAGQVRFDRNRIHVFPAVAGPLLLSFHWVEGLTVKPPLVLRARYLEDDPIPFISVDNSAGIKDFEIRYEPR